MVIENDINFTPEILINGKTYPKQYTKPELLYFLEELIEDPINIKTKKGKRSAGSYGVSRKRKETKAAIEVKPKKKAPKAEDLIAAIDKATTKDEVLAIFNNDTRKAVITAMKTKIAELKEADEKSDERK